MLHARELADSQLVITTLASIYTSLSTNLSDSSVAKKYSYSSLIVDPSDVGYKAELVFLCSRIYTVVVAQLVRAPDCGSGGRGFETHLPPSVYA